jgi:hypothetical protein
MNKFLLASVAVLGLAGVAVAQEVPAFYGENPYATTVDGSPAAHIVSGQANATVPTTDGYNIHQNDNYSGK